MKSSVREPMLKWRTSLGMVTVLCLLWHILLPTMVHMGIVPALYAMPSHCQVTHLQKSLNGSTSHFSNHSSLHHESHLHHQEQNPDQLSDHAREVFVLAGKVMKHCPLCSYGMDAAAIVLFIAMILVIVLAWFTRIRCLCHGWTQTPFIPRIVYILPLKHAPPCSI